MSRIGKSPIIIPNGVNVEFDSVKVSVSGPKGNLECLTLPGINIAKSLDSANEILVSRDDDQPKTRGKHGLMRSLINNMVIGVSQGYSKKLELNGVGYRVSMAGSDLRLNIGFSHEVKYKTPSGVMVTVEQNIITVSGIDKQQVGQVAAEIRSLKKPEPYKGKGIKYVNERIIRKSGKSGKDK